MAKKYTHFMVHNDNYEKDGTIRIGMGYERDKMLAYVDVPAEQLKDIVNTLAFIDDIKDKKWEEVVK